MQEVKRENPKCVILVTGAAGFIGSYLCRKLLETKNNCQVIGFDNLNDYYDVELKRERLQMIAETEGDAGAKVNLGGFSIGRFIFIRGDLANEKEVNDLFRRFHPRIVVNLAAQAGVRYSIQNPRSYIDSNLIGFFNVLEACRNYPVGHLIYASSSSVYGNSDEVPFSELDQTDAPVSLYAATKKSNELLAYAYASLYGLPATGLRFFTVYGPMGRPDMAYFSFAEKLCAGDDIQIFNYGNCKRDFTYIDDIVEGIVRVMDLPFDTEVLKRAFPPVTHRVYNIGNNHPENLLHFVAELKRALVNAGVLPTDYRLEEHQELVPMQAGDVIETCADTSRLERDTGFKPLTPLSIGLARFAEWYKTYVDSSIH